MYFTCDRNTTWVLLRVISKLICNTVCEHRLDIIIGIGNIGMAVRMKKYKQMEKSRNMKWEMQFHVQPRCIYF